MPHFVEKLENQYRYLCLLKFCNDIFFKILFIYLSGTEGERASEHRQTERQAEAEGEAGSLPSKEPDAGLDSRTLGS